MKLLRAFAVFASIGLVACGDDPTEPPPEPLVSSIRAPEILGPESTAVGATANKPARWRVTYGVATDREFSTPWVGPSTSFRVVLRGLLVLTTYRYRIHATDGVAEVSLPDEFRTPDYEPCDSRNTTAQRVPVTMVYRPTVRQPSPFVNLAGVEVIDCAGRALTDPRHATVLSQDGGLSYVLTLSLPVNYPDGSRPHTVRARRVIDDWRYDGWMDLVDTRFNGVLSSSASEPLPPSPPCVPEAGCQPYPRLHVWVGGQGDVH